MSTIANLLIEVKANTSAVTSAFSAIEKTMASLNKTAEKVLASNKMSTEQGKLANETANANQALRDQTVAVAAVAAAMVIMYKAIGSFIYQSVKAKSDLIEMQNVVDVVFKDNAKEMDAWAITAGKSFGISQLAAKTYVGVMGQIFTSLGLGGKAVENMSVKIASLAGDLASFRNLSVEEAFVKLQAGIVGEIEPLRAVGINLQQFNLENFAMTKGIKVNFLALTEAQKAMLRYAYILNATSMIQGDFVRTQKNFANQARITQLNMIELKLALGEALYPVLLLGVNLINNFLVSLTDLGKSFNKLSGPTKLFLGLGATMLILIPAVTIAIWALSVAKGWYTKTVLLAAGAQGVFTKAVMTTMGVVGVLLLLLGYLVSKYGVVKNASKTLNGFSDEISVNAQRTHMATQSAKKYATGIDGIGKSVKKLLGIAGIDELNVLGKSSSIGSILDTEGMTADFQKMIDDINDSQKKINPVNLADMISFDLDWGKTWDNFMKTAPTELKVGTAIAIGIGAIKLVSAVKGLWAGVGGMFATGAAAGGAAVPAINTAISGILGGLLAGTALVAAIGLTLGVIFTLIFDPVKREEIVKKYTDARAESQKAIDTVKTLPLSAIFKAEPVIKIPAFGIIANAFVDAWKYLTKAPVYVSNPLYVSPSIQTTGMTTTWFDGVVASVKKAWGILTKNPVQITLPINILAAIASGGFGGVGVNGGAGGGGGSSWAVGTSYVPQTQMALIHKGEAITPAGTNSNNQSRTDDILEKIDRFISAFGSQQMATAGTTQVFIGNEQLYDYTVRAGDNMKNRTNGR